MPGAQGPAARHAAGGGVGSYVHSTPAATLTRPVVADEAAGRVSHGARRHVCAMRLNKQYTGDSIGDEGNKR